MNVYGQRYFLSVIVDLYNNEVISHQLSRSLGVGFVIRTIKNAINLRPTKDLIIHSDQGMHYTTRVFGKLLKDNGITQSMSRKGNYLDNACIESFFGHLKSELRPHTLQLGFKGLSEALRNYINFYNTERYQSKLGDMSPIEYRDGKAKTA